MKKLTASVMERSQERSHARSVEENDLLERSHKKVRSADHLPPEQPLQDAVMQVEDSRSSSFKDMLLGGECELEDWPFKDDDNDLYDENQDLDCPSVTINKDEKKHLRQPWKTTLIVRFLGRNIGYTTIDPQFCLSILAFILWVSHSLIVLI